MGVSVNPLKVLFWAICSAHQNSGDRVRMKQNNDVNDFYLTFNCTYMHSRHAEGIVIIYSEIPETYFSTKLTLGVMGLKLTTLSEEPVDHKPIVK